MARPPLPSSAAGHVLKREGEDLAVRMCDALGLLFAALLVFFQIRHALNGGDPLADTSGHVEQGLFALMSLGFAYVLMRLDVGARQSGVPLRVAGVRRRLGHHHRCSAWASSRTRCSPATACCGPVVFSSLLLAYLLPGLAAVLLARTARGVRPDWYVTGAAVLATAAAVWLRDAGGSPRIPG